ncbi:MAG TPA: cytochrome c, partial [Candidatus Dormibacteraeota bacterium]|nr:cytochrome c [Candidatus Dormibacteraeota bacterium]
MFRGLIVGILLGIVLVIVGVYLYFSTGSAPVAVTAPLMPFERTFAHMALNAYLKKLPHPEPQVPENEASYMAGAEVY